MERNREASGVGEGKYQRETGTRRKMWKDRRGKRKMERTRKRRVQRSSTGRRRYEVEKTTMVKLT